MGDRQQRPAFDPGLKPFVELAITDLAERLEVDRCDISVESAALVTWSDRGFLGSAGDAPTRWQQMPIDGSEIVLVAEGQSFRYRTGGDVYRPVLTSPPKTI